MDTPDRATLRAVQTPQGFRRDVLVRLHAAAAGGPPLTDDAALAEAAGIEVVVVPGHAEAFKVTHHAEAFEEHRRRVAEARGT